jgi:putative hydrolase of the HAD superfamily
MAALPITALFLDVGGVLLTNGWDRYARNEACETFKLDPEEINERHHLTFDTYEEGKLSLEEYLDRVIFFQPRDFSRHAFKDFMFARSQPHPEMLELIPALKARYGLKIAVVSNEGRELMTHRIRTYRLSDFVDFFIVSSFVHFRKPDADIFRIALDIAQVPPQQVVYIEDRDMFVNVAEGLGLRGLVHRGFESTRAGLAQLGLAL